MPSKLLNSHLEEANLPQLPVPSLNSSLEKLKASLKPLMNDQEYHDLLNKIEEFKVDPVSSALQNHLLKFHENNDCYLTPLNLDHILIDHKALPRNPFLVLENDPSKTSLTPQTQSHRSAVLTNSALKFVSALRQGTLSKDLSRDGTPLTMEPYFNLFGSTRYPEFEGIRSKRNDQSDSLLVISKFQFYSLKVLNENNELIFTTAELSSIFDEIIEDSSTFNEMSSSPIGAITSDTFKNWRNLRKSLSTTYKQSMSKIDSALFVLVLDHTEPEESESSLAEAIGTGTQEINERGIQTGSCISRWYDKLQLVVTKNCIAGVIWDSFSQDGTNVLRFTSDIYSDSALRLADGNYTLFPGVQLAKSEAPKPKFEKIMFNFAQDTKTQLYLSSTRLTDLICSHATNTSVLNYGRNFARKIGVKSDSLIQVSLQIAQYALYGKAASTVEPVSTRQFQNSRSELLPVQSEQIIKTAQIFVSDSSPLERWRSFIESCKSHSKGLRKASNGEGFEKHLKALQNVYLQREVLNQYSPEHKIADEMPPLIFDDVIYPLFTPEIVASNCGNPAMRLFGLTPAVAHGFGIGYIIKDDVTEFCLISQYRQGDRLLSTLEWVLHQLSSIWKHHVGVKRFPHAYQLDNLKQPRSRFVESNGPIHSESMTRSFTSTSSEEDVDVALGGYGYFDIDELTLRSTPETPTGSLRNSSVDLLKLHEKIDKNFGKRLFKSEHLKDKYENFKDSGTDSGDDGLRGDKFDAKFDRGEVGKKVIIDEMF